MPILEIRFKYSELKGSSFILIQRTTAMHKIYTLQDIY
jgi:hypothetical protein